MMETPRSEVGSAAPTRLEEGMEAPDPRGTSVPSRRAGVGGETHGARDLPGEFSDWYRDYRPTVYQYVRFRVATREVAEDLTSDVFFKALRSFRRFDPRKASAQTWLLRIARNTVTDHFRALRRRHSLHVSLDRVSDLVSDSPSHEERIIYEEHLQAILNAHQTLRGTDQEILSLRFGAGLDNAEIAETLDITRNAVAVRIHRALKRLRDALELSDDEGDEGQGPERRGQSQGWGEDDEP